MKWCQKTLNQKQSNHAAYHSIIYSFALCLNASHLVTEEHVTCVGDSLWSLSQTVLGDVGSFVTGHAPLKLICGQICDLQRKTKWKHSQLTGWKTLWWWTFKIKILRQFYVLHLSRLNQARDYILDLCVEAEREDTKHVSHHEAASSAQFKCVWLHFLSRPLDGPPGKLSLHWCEWETPPADIKATVSDVMKVMFFLWLS